MFTSLNVELEREISGVEKQEECCGQREKSNELTPPENMKMSILMKISDFQYRKQNTLSMAKDMIY